MTKEIRLTQDQITLVDDEDFEWASKFNWCVLKTNKNLFYALRTGRVGEGKRKKSVFLHREILSASKGVRVDHINGNGLDNRRSNLRLATHAENIHNSRICKSNTSGYKGVSWSKSNKKWHVKITVSGANIYLGHFDSLKEAALVYDEAAKKYFGEFARTNF